jgi:hypothetical protein
VEGLNIFFIFQDVFTEGVKENMEPSTNQPNNAEDSVVEESFISLSPHTDLVRLVHYSD